MVFQCQGCGSEVEGRRSRVYCSNACQRDLERRKRLAQWLETGAAPHAGSARGHYIRRFIHEEQGGRCALCSGPAEWNGLPLVLVLDHIDGDADNNSRDNLRLICPNCDSQLETYKGRNWGRGRHVRRQRYAEGRSY